MARLSLPMPVTPTVWTTTTTTITSTAAIFAVQAGLVYKSYTGLRAPSLRTYAVRGSSNEQSCKSLYPEGSILVDPGRTGTVAILAPVCVLSSAFVAASALVLRRWEQLVELQQGLLDIRNLAATDSMVA